MARTRILVVDDELGILDLVQYHLSKARYDVVVVESGEEALADVSVTERAADVHLVSLRRKLGPVGETTEIIRGVSYCLQE